MHYLLTHLDDAWALTVVHLRLSLVPVLIGSGDRGSAGRARCSARRLPDG